MDIKIGNSYSACSKSTNECMLTFLVLQLLQGATGLVNLSINKTADMSSSQYSDKWLADEAVDGDVSQKLAQGSCAVTSDNFKKQAWWRVDLGDTYVLNSVKLYYRKENEDPTMSLTHWLSGFSIYVADTLNWWIGTRCYIDNNGEQSIPGPTAVLTVPCNATGRYITIYKQRNNTCVWSLNSFYKIYCTQFEICEVQVLSCEDGTYGKSCSNNCSGNCLYGDHCNKAHGGCDDGCAPGYRGFYCNDVCPPGRYGVNCKHSCSKNCRNISNCRNTDGYCEACTEGWIDNSCNTKCMPGTFGSKCSNTCGYCIGSTCNHINGTCPVGCSPGWEGHYCNETCNDGYYGHQCSRTCTSCAETCHHVTGKCLVYEKQSTEDHNTAIVVISVTSGILVTTLGVALVLTCLRMQNLSLTHGDNCKNVEPIRQEQTQVEMSNIAVDIQDNGNVMHQVTVTDNIGRTTYEAVMSVTNDFNTYETLQSDRAVTYTNTQLVF